MRTRTCACPNAVVERSNPSDGTRLILCQRHADLHDDGRAFTVYPVGADLGLIEDDATRISLEARGIADAANVLAGRRLTPCESAPILAQKHQEKCDGGDK